MPRFRSMLLVLAMLVFAACPAVASAHVRPGDQPGLDSGYDDDPGYVDEGDADDTDVADDAGDDSDCAAYLDDLEGDGYDPEDAAYEPEDESGDASLRSAGAGEDACAYPGDDAGLDVADAAPDFAPPTPSIPRPVGPKLVHLHANGRVWVSPKLPRVVRRVIGAANRIATRPYKYGGGHGSFLSRGYDCSGSVSYALHGGGLLFSTLTSGGLAHWGAKGKGRWITIYANASHTYMVVAGMRFDTGARPRSGTRWDPWERPARGFAVRHPAGL